jgi:signal transduction histidine kinase
MPCQAQNPDGHLAPNPLTGREGFTTKRPGEGTAMGLVVVHGIVTGHGGAITVESAPVAARASTSIYPAATPPSPRRSPWSATAEVLAGGVGK